MLVLFFRGWLVRDALQSRQYLTDAAAVLYCTVSAVPGVVASVRMVKLQ